MALTSDGHDGRSYAPSGPEAVTFDDVADALSTVLGRSVSFVAVPDDAAYAQLVGAGVPEEFATPLVATFAALRGGAGTQVTDAVRVLTGREPRSIGEFLSDQPTRSPPEPSLEGAREHAAVSLAAQRDHHRTVTRRRRDRAAPRAARPGELPLMSSSGGSWWSARPA